MRLEEHKHLWTRIRGFPIDDPDAAIKFSDKLAFENNWSAGFTLRAIEEYKRFILLCCISPTGASPSEVVDEVWHLHLTYTRNYWIEFCRNTIGKDIHHHPSKGGATEKARHVNWYRETIELYRDVFGESPPIDIWPPPAEILNRESNIEIPGIDYTVAYKKHLFILALPFLYPLFFGKLHPFTLTGPQFLGFFPLLITSVLIVFRYAYINKSRMIASVVEELYNGNATSYQLARFIYGNNKAIQAAVVDLASKRVIEANSWGSLNIYPSRYNPHRDRDNPLSSAFRQHHEEGQRIKLSELASYYDDNVTYHQGLANIYRSVTKTDKFRILIIVLLAFIVVARLMQGNANERPIDYLIIMAFISTPLIVRSVQTLSTRNILREIFGRKYAQQDIEVEYDSVAAKFIFLGMASLGSMYALSNLDTTFKNNKDWSTTASTSGCGSSGCGSSCGGGCGGCGGD